MEYAKYKKIRIAAIIAASHGHSIARLSELPSGTAEEATRRDEQVKEMILANYLKL